MRRVQIAAFMAKTLLITLPKRAVGVSGSAGMMEPGHMIASVARWTDSSKAAELADPLRMTQCDLLLPVLL